MWLLGEKAGDAADSAGLLSVGTCGFVVDVSTAISVKAEWKKAPRFSFSDFDNVCVLCVRLCILGCFPSIHVLTPTLSHPVHVVALCVILFSVVR